MGSESSELQALLGRLSENAGRPFEEALSLPPGLYHSAECLQLEIARIFHQEWFCVGRAAEMPHPGDFITLDIVDQPVFAIRQRDGSIRAFVNACVHRSSKLLSGRGRAARISCPYHSWTYNPDGRLIGAPFMDQRPGFDVRDHRLNELRCELWQGFVYVTLNETAESPMSRLADLAELVGQYRMADYVPVIEQEEVWQTNWKCLVENFMDAYHIHRVHARSFGAHGKSEENTHLFTGGSAYTYHYVDKTSSGAWARAHPANTWLKGGFRRRIMLLCIFPTHTIQLQPDMLWYLSIQPRGVGQVCFRWSAAVPAEILDSVPDRGAHIAELTRLLTQVNSEDQPTVEGLFKAARSNRAGQGPLSHLERNVFEFDRYLARALCGG